MSPFAIGMVTDPRVVLEAFDRGINFFFLTADMHWPHYDATRRGLRELLAGRPSAREDLVVGVVSYVAPEFAVEPLREVVQEIQGLDRIDLVIAGAVTAVEDGRLDVFAAHRRQGLIQGAQALGATFHNRAAAVCLLDRGNIDIAFVRYNADHRRAESDVFPRLRNDRTALLYNFKSACGHVPHARFDELQFDRDSWRPRVQDQYRFVLTRPELDGVLCSPRTPAELEALERALAEGPLTAEQQAYMKCLTDLHHSRVHK